MISSQMLSSQMLSSQMVLPDDVLTIISAYSKPVFRYFREYKRALKLNYLDEWPTLKEKLNEEMVPVLLAYLIATEDWRESMYSQYQLFQNPGIRQERERDRRRIDSDAKKFTMNKRFRELSLLLYGKEMETYRVRDHSKPNAWI